VRRQKLLIEAHNRSLGFALPAIDFSPTSTKMPKEVKQKSGSEFPLYRFSPVNANDCVSQLPSV
jgi:hypothetical protein